MALAQTLDDLAAFARAGSFNALRVPRLMSLGVPARVTVGDVLVVEWRTQNCTSVMLRVRGVQPLVRRLAANGRVGLPVEAAGDWQVALELRGDSDITLVPERTVQVLKAPLAINVSGASVSCQVGATAIVRWASEGAATTTVTRGAETLGLAAQGKLEVEMGYQREQLVFESVGVDGSRSQAVCELVPLLVEAKVQYISAQTSIETELNIINQPLALRL